MKIPITTIAQEALNIECEMHPGLPIIVIATDYRAPPPTESVLASNLRDRNVGLDVLRSVHRGLLGVSMPDGQGMDIMPITQFDGIDMTMIVGDAAFTSLAVLSSLERKALLLVINDLYSMARP